MIHLRSNNIAERHQLPIKNIIIVLHLLMSFTMIERYINDFTKNSENFSIRSYEVFQGKIFSKLMKKESYWVTSLGKKGSLLE